jgi:hypothetical protein
MLDWMSTRCVWKKGGKVEEGEAKEERIFTDSLSCNQCALAWELTTRKVFLAE